MTKKPTTIEELLKEQTPHPEVVLATLKSYADAGVPLSEKCRAVNVLINTPFTPEERSQAREILYKGWEHLKEKDPDNANQYQFAVAYLDEERLHKAGFYSRVDFAIPRDLSVRDYQQWMDSEIIKPWLVAKEGNSQYQDMITGPWNSEGYINVTLRGRFIGVKFSKYDGKAYRIPQGIVVRDHYSKADVEMVHYVANNLEEFLKEQNIEFTRTNEKRPEHLR